MGVSVYWRPVSTASHNITPGARSAFYEAITETFGDMPIKIDGGHLPLLQAMRVAAGDAETKKSYQELIDAINKHEEIEIYSAW